MPVVLDLVEILLPNPRPEAPKENLIGSLNGDLKTAAKIELFLINDALIRTDMCACFALIVA
jgi:hypothetical protein